MKKNCKKYCIIAVIATILIAIIIVLSVCLGRKDNSETKSKYEMELIYDDENHILKGSERFDFFNNYDNMFTKLYFHLYPNAFREESKAKVVDKLSEEKAYPNGKDFGYIHINSVEILDKQTQFNIVGEDENILEVVLFDELYPNEKVEIHIDFDVKLANINHRLGYGKNTINFGNFYPIMCIYEEGKGFVFDLYSPNGDPFYSECSNFEVNIAFKNQFDIASTGCIEKIEENGDIKNVYVSAKNVRDFFFSLSSNWTKLSQEESGTVINYYGYKDDLETNLRLKTAMRALSFFNDLYGKYPYKELNVVKSNFIHGGMEYPNIVLISDTESGQDSDYVIVHEIAHQWWYGVVGNDQYSSAWIDEGLAEYSTLLFFKKYDDYIFQFDSMMQSISQSYKTFEYVFQNITGSVDGRIQRRLDEFNSSPEYVQCIYNKTVLMFDSLKDAIGEKRLNKSLRKIYKDFAYKNISPQQFIHYVSKISGRNIDSFMKSWLDGKVIIK